MQPKNSFSETRMAHNSKTKQFTSFLAKSTGGLSTGFSSKRFSTDA
jgi:hypothetical protein